MERGTVRVKVASKFALIKFIILLETLCNNNIVVIYLFFLQIPIILGVFLNSYYDVKFNWVGTIYASLGVIVTSVYQVVSCAMKYIIVNVVSSR